MPALALIGVTGRLGGRGAARLVGDGLTPRLLVRDPSRAPDLSGCEVAAAPYADIADVAATVLHDPGRHAGRTYDLTGPEALSLDEVAATITAVAGRPVTDVRETVEEAYGSRAPIGAPE
jgi:uncharacterized protein YbjT (DUF2867 family)